jgi:hypothetical protein
MVDRYVYWAVTRNAKLGTTSMVVVLERFKHLLIENQDLLDRLGALLASRLRVPAGTITTVRVLDSLLWFDWWAIYRYASDFRRYVAPNSKPGGREHLVREDGEAFAASQGMR